MKIINISMMKEILCSMMTLGLIFGVGTTSFAESETLKKVKETRLCNRSGSE